MQFLSRKNRWQRLLDKSGLVTVGTMAGLTAVSAVVSAVRHSKDDK